MKKKLIISFSGGRTSAYMTWWLMKEWKDREAYEIIVVFANTGKEDEGTLFFVDECAQEWNISIVWIEGYPSDKGQGWGVESKVVNYETASRNGEPFEAMIKRLGIPTVKAPFCSPQLKRRTIKAYARSIGWKHYTVAVGYRLEESKKRVNRKQKEQKVIYPLVDIHPMNKIDIISWWLTQPFNLEINPDAGNCDNCWKKPNSVLIRNMQRNPKSFDWWEDMEKKYGYFNPRPNNILKPPFNFFRGNNSVADIRKMAEKLNENELQQMSMFEGENGCGESCEAF